MENIVFNPYWNVPDKILEKEILPLVAKNKNYLADNHMEWYDGRLRQKPGEDNALGEIKFLFPNPFDIYLHDTPAKGLFQEERRAFSHGCIRIAEPHRLALYLLRDKKGWSSEEMDRVLALKSERYIKMDKKVALGPVITRMVKCLNWHYTKRIQPMGNGNHFILMVHG